MIFHGKKKSIPNDLPDLILNGEPIQRVDDFKYIGLHLDPTLCWTKHINFICSRLNRFFGIFRYLRDKIPFHLKRQIYLTTASPIINYGIELYGSSNKKNISKLQSKQNQLLKVLFNLPYRTETDVLYSKLSLTLTRKPLNGENSHQEIKGKSRDISKCMLN